MNLIIETLLMLFYRRRVRDDLIGSVPYPDNPNHGTKRA